jgi:AcrR family transcriptional regulator
MRAVSAAPHPFLQNVTAEGIVDAALSIVGAGPVADLTVEQVQLKAGTSTSSIYHYFGNRQGLLAAS